MCGICGIYSKMLPIAQRRTMVEEMLRGMAHRGPDGTAGYSDDAVSLGVVRLAIVDRSHGDPLVWNEERTVVAAFNGEIYNHEVLRSALARNHGVKTRTDSEVLVHLFEELGIEHVHKLSGDYAYALWDARAQGGYLIRDPMGVKPLYYADLGDARVFSSEVRPMLACFPELAELDYSALDRYLTYRFVPGPQTIFRHIRKLPPGSYLSLHPGSAPITYWQLPQGAVASGTDEAFIRSGRAILERAIGQRIPTEVHYGVLLSGGLDSSLISAVAARRDPEPVRTYSVVYVGHGSDSVHSEHEYSRMVAHMLGTQHTEVNVTASLFKERCLRTALHLEEPIADPPAVLLGLICEEAQQSVRVLLSGEGADELFAGYSVYVDLAASSGEYTGMGRLLGGEQKRALLSGTFLRGLDREQDCDTTRTGGSRATPLPPHDLTSMLITDCTRWLVDDLLAKADKMGMMASIEIRVPYLDRESVHFAFSLPVDSKIRGNVTKWTLREIARAYLPPGICDQPKRGFPLPLGVWIRGELRAWATGVILDSLSRRGYFDATALNTLVRDYLTGPESRFWDHVIWSLISLELFHQAIIDR